MTASAHAETAAAAATADGCCDGGGLDARDRTQRRVLAVLLAINGGMFLVEAAAGWIAQSTGLLGDSLDMLADATVYGVALWAVGRSEAAKGFAARLCGILQIGLAFLVMGDVVRRWLVGSTPGADWMIGVGALALVANVACMLLLWRHRGGGVHMRATWICSRNDVLVNSSVIAGGALVWLTGSRLPDLLLGSLISVTVLMSGIKIVRVSRSDTGSGCSA
jgi:Co/Zn/Cd efflux system component